MKLEHLFTPEELSLIDSGEYRPGRAVLDEKLDLCAAIEREACAKIVDDWFHSLASEPEMEKIAEQIRARGQA